MKKDNKKQKIVNLLAYAIGMAFLGFLSGRFARFVGGDADTGLLMMIFGMLVYIAMCLSKEVK